MHSVDHNDFFAHVYRTDPGNFLNTLNSMLKCQYLTKIVLIFNLVKEAL